MTDGVIGSRVKVGAWLVAEDRNVAYEGSQETDNPLDERTTIRVPVLTVDVRITEQIGVQAAATIPDVTRSALVPRPGGPSAFTETFSGLGDTSLIGWYRLAPIDRWNIVLNGGVSLPTGRTERPRFQPELQNGSLVPMSRLQRGSGTVDPLIGVNVDRRLPALTLFGSLAARTPFYENGDGLRTGASWELSGGVGRELGSHRLIGFGRLGWLHRKRDHFAGTPVLVGGGDWLYLTPGVAVQIGKGFTTQVEVKLPIHRSVLNRQLDSRAILQLGISRMF